MAGAIVLDNQEGKITRFPEKIEKYFLDREIVIDLYPADLVSDQEYGDISLKITSAEQYFDFLSNEISFWGENDPKKKMETIAHYSRFQSAKTSFDMALHNSELESSVKNHLNQSISYFSSGALYSKTSLAEKLLNYVDKSSHFITGFKAGMLIEGTSSISANADVFQGFFAAMAYRNVFDSYQQISKDEIESFKTKFDEASDNYSLLNQKYTQSFFDLQNGLQSVKEQTNAHFDNFFEKEKSFFDNATTTLSALEKQYRENLALKAPAEYWKDLETDYRKKSRFWMIMSAVVSAIIVALLGAILFFTQGIFVDKTNWLENAKISVIITVIISVSIYMLRTTIKMAISSLHLSRDAKERQNLSVFYLSLIEDGAVTDKERSIIINALFSRVDTGLLKGDSSPAMSNNVTDLIGIVKNIK